MQVRTDGNVPEMSRNEGSKYRIIVDKSRNDVSGEKVRIACKSKVHLEESSSDHEPPQPGPGGDNELVSGQPEEDGCLRVAQLMTEVVLLLFVSCLLSIATLVIVSKKVPSFMEYYEVVPETLFFLCIIVAIISFMHWLCRRTKLFWRGRASQPGRMGAEPDQPASIASIASIEEGKTIHLSRTQTDQPTNDHPSRESIKSEEVRSPQNAAP